MRERRSGRDHRVEIGEVGSEEPRGPDRILLDQERAARIDISDPVDLAGDTESTRRLSVGIGEELYVADPERHCPGSVRPGRISRDRERPNARLLEVDAPVAQEQQLVRAGR